MLRRSFATPLILAVLTVLALTMSRPAAAKRFYDVLDLGTLPGGTSSVAFGINNAGQAVGASETFGGAVHAFLYPSDTALLLKDLGTFPAGTSSVALGINNPGSVVGFSETGEFDEEIGDPIYHASLWQPSTGMQDLGALREYPYSQAFSINESGQIAGTLSTPERPAPQFATVHAALWEEGVLQDLHNRVTLGDRNSAAFGINNLGQVVGYSDIARRVSHAYLYDLNTTGLLDLGTLGGTSSVARSINDNGQVAGYSLITGNRGYHAFLYPSDGGSLLKDLETLGGSSSFAYGINGAGQVVGTSTLFGDQVSHAFLWESGVMQDLNYVIPEDSGWVLTSANAVNDAGQVVGKGRINGEEHAFLLLPQ